MMLPAKGARTVRSRGVAHTRVRIIDRLRIGTELSALRRYRRNGLKGRRCRLPIVVTVVRSEEKDLIFLDRVGPLTYTPNSFCFSIGVVGGKNPRASSTVLRK